MDATQISSFSSVNNFNIVPDELIINLFEFLDIQSLLRFGQTSKNNYNRTGQASLWRELCFNAKLICKTSQFRDEFCSALNAGNNSCLLVHAKRLAKKSNCFPGSLICANNKLDAIITSQTKRGDFFSSCAQHARLKKLVWWYKNRSSSQQKDTDPEKMTGFKSGLSNVASCIRTFDQDKITAKFYLTIQKYNKGLIALSDLEKSDVCSEFASIYSSIECPLKLRERSLVNYLELTFQEVSLKNRDFVQLLEGIYDKAESTPGMRKIALCYLTFMNVFHREGNRKDLQVLGILKNASLKPYLPAILPLRVAACQVLMNNKEGKKFKAFS